MTMYIIYICPKKNTISIFVEDHNFVIIQVSLIEICYKQWHDMVFVIIN